MKRIVCLLLATFSLSLVAQNLTERTPVSFSSEPTTIEEFKTIQAATATSPEGGAAVLVLAISMYGKNPELGRKAVVLSVLSKNRQKSNKPTAVDGVDLGGSDSYLLAQLDKYKMLPNGYWKGSEPSNGYTPSIPLTVETYTNPYSGEESSGKIKLFVATRGASTYRPVSVEKDTDGLWRAKEMSSLFVGMMPAKQIFGVLLSLHPVVLALLATGFTWLCTAFGAGFVFFFRTVPRPVFNAMLGFASGTMIFVVVEELILESHTGKETEMSTLGAMFGFVLMMALDVGLG